MLPVLTLNDEGVQVNASPALLVVLHRLALGVEEVGSIVMRTSVSVPSEVAI